MTPQGVASKIMSATTAKREAIWQQSVAKKKQAETSQNTEQAHRVEVAPSRQEEEEYTLYRVNSKRSTKPLMVDVKLTGTSTSIEVDTGASVSLLGVRSEKVSPVSLRASILAQNRSQAIDPYFQ